MQTFLPIIWFFTEGDGIEFRLPFKIFSTLCLQSGEGVKNTQKSSYVLYECPHREKNFAFVRMSTRSEAEKVKTKLDGQMKNGRALKVRFSPHQGAVKVSNLGKFIDKFFR